MSYPVAAWLVPWEFTLVYQRNAAADPTIQQQRIGAGCSCRTSAHNRYF